MSDVPRVEDKITVTNGRPGLSSILIVVNGKKFKVDGLKNGEERTIDVSSAMREGERNKVVFTAHGRWSSWANVMIWDGVGQ